MPSRPMLTRAAAAGVLLLACVTASPATAQTEFNGQTRSGAYYKIQVPDGWTPADGLAIWNHGFSLSPIGPVQDMGPLAALQLSEDYAVAASSYSQIGWALFNTLDDNQQLVEVFENTIGIPDQVMIYGASLGGLVTAQAVEQGGMGNVVGALPVCGALAGSKAWDGGLDLRLLYDYVCENVAGAAIAGGTTGLAFPPDPNFDPNALAAAVNNCTGVLLPPSQRSAEQIANLNQLQQLTGLPEEFILTDMGFVTFGLADLVFDPRKLGGGQGLDNAHADYGDTNANNGVQRVLADANARALLRRNYTPNGRVGEVKIVSLHTDKDGLVIVEHESDYAAKVPPENLSIGIIVEDTPTHCDFSEAELVAGWESLRGWVAGLPQPDAADLQTTCEAIANGGLAAGPCRIDPNFQIPEIDGRIRPRDICVPDAETLCLGGRDGNRFRVTADWTNFRNRSGTGKTVDAQTDKSGLFWFFGSDNWEVLLKVLDSCHSTDHFWVFSAATTNMEYTLTVVDTETNASRTYFNQLGRSAPAVTDTQAFATCP